MTPLLDAQSISVHFGGIKALDDVSLDVRAGELVGLVGPNGAGKTTLFNCIVGLERPSAGKVSVDGRDVTTMAVHRRARLGIGRTFQRLELFAGMSVREHVIVADRAHRRSGGLLADLVGRGRPTAVEIARAEETLDLVGLAEAAPAPVESLPLGQGRLVELARALVSQPRLLLLDEPSSGLDADETARLAGVITEIRKEAGSAVLLVEHDLDLVRALAERLFVLDSGRMLASGAPAAVLADVNVVAAYVGTTP
ncbi:MAG: ABC transporter ATP-binding protein [Actinomycetes bacterium]